MSADNFTCRACGGTNVEVCLPAWFAPNEKLKLRDVDADSDALAVWCCDCDSDAPLLAPNGTTITGQR